MRSILIFKEVRLLFVTPLLYPFFAKEYQGIPKTKIKNVDLTTFYQGMQKNNGAGGSRTHVQTPANILPVESVTTPKDNKTIIPHLTQKCKKEIN